MICEVDQSGKVEQMSLDTVIALSNSQQISVFLSKKEKRALQEIFRHTRQKHIFIYLIFSALLAICLKKGKNIEVVTVDREYLHNEDIIKQKLIVYLQRLKMKKIPQIKFGLVGKKSPAHELAKKVARKKIKPTVVVNEETILNLVLQ